MDKSEICRAYRAFIDDWQPENETDNEFLLSNQEVFKSHIAFCLSGHPEILLHEDKDLKEKWQKSLLSSNVNKTPIISQCGIIGDKLPVARIHGKIKGVPGGDSKGNTLISFNNPSEYSYCREQSVNSNVSEIAMNKYTSALNVLMADKRHRTLIDDTVVFHWASSGNDSCDDLFNMLTFSDSLDAEHTEEAVERVIKNAADGVVLADIDELLENIDTNVDFYVVGMKPNSARLAVSFVYRQKFGRIVENLLQHQVDMKISGNEKPVPVWQIKKELVSPKSSNEKANPNTVVKLFDAVLYGHNYPSSLMATVIRRIKTDSDTDTNGFIKMNPVRIGILKACINRDDRLKGKEEEIKMSLDTQNRNPAYVCGRLFAVLENIQQRSAGYRTIKDAYFTSASSKPATVFPKLLHLAQHHLAKIDNSRYADESITELLDMISGEFPDTLTLKEQGVFIIGYYQQKAYTSNKIKEYKENNEKEGM